MDKLLESLISKAKLECEEAHRQLLFAHNGLFKDLYTVLPCFSCIIILLWFDKHIMLYTKSLLVIFCFNLWQVLLVFTF